MTYFSQHLNDINESYFVHLRHALRFSATMAIGSLACLIHAIFPFLCVKSGSNIITAMHYDMVTHRDKLKGKSINTSPNTSIATAVDEGIAESM